MKISSKDQLTNDILRSCYEIAQNYFQNPQVILYGSRAREEASQSSDWDILLIIENNLDKEKIENFRFELYQLELKLNQVITIIIKSKDDWLSKLNQVTPFFKNVNNEGFLYEPRNK